MKYCQKCGYKNANYAKFCVKCGNSFVEMDIDTIKKHNVFNRSNHLKDTHNQMSKQENSNSFNKPQFKDNTYIKPTLKYKLFYIFDERKNKYRISKLKVILGIELVSFVVFSIYIVVFVQSDTFAVDFANNPFLTVFLLIMVSITIAGMFMVPTGIIGWILRKIYLYLTK